MARNEDWIRWPKYIGKGARQYKRLTPMDPEQPNWLYCTYGRDTEKKEWEVQISGGGGPDDEWPLFWTVRLDIDIAWRHRTEDMRYRRPGAAAQELLFSADLGEYPTQRAALEAFAAMLKL